MKRPNLWEYTSLIQMSNHHQQQQPEEAAASSLSPSQSSSSSSNRVGYHKDDGDVQDDADDVEKSSNVHSYYYKRNDDKVKVDEDLFLNNNGGGHDDDDDDDDGDDDILPNRRLQQQQQQGNRQSTTTTAKTAAATRTTNTNTNTTTTQQCFNLDSIISKKARNQTLFTITRAGTKSSRSGLYIRPSWKLVLYHHLQKRYRVYIAIIVTLLLVRPWVSTLVQRNKYEESSSSSSSSSLSNIDDELLIDLGRDGYLKFPLEKEMGQQDESLCAVYVTDGSSSSTSSSSGGTITSTSTSSSSSLSPSRPTPFQCKCINPMNAKMGFYPGWNKAHEANKNMIEEYYHSHNGSRVLDVVFLGDSITEEWNGRWLGNQQDTWKDIHEEWKRLFDPSVTLGALNGLALGIAGDSIANLLWRIKNGELEHVNSKIFWLLIGTNDLSLGCSDKTILLGILHLVEEVRKLKPESIIVLNGLLPRTNDGEGRLGMEVGTGTNNGNVVNGHEEEMQLTSTTTTTTTTITTTTTREQRISPWQSIQSINRSLAKFAQQHDRIEYFDASDIFVGRMGTKVYHRNELFLLKELQNDFLHPTALGHKLWGEAIVDYITSDVDTPENLRRRMYRSL